ncbi:MAG: hypothetical protein R3B45_05390 [Bdellovibrionota bacterium]
MLRVFQQQIFGEDFAEDDYRSYPPRKLIRYVSSLKSELDEVGDEVSRVEQQKVGQSKNKLDEARETYWKATYLLFFQG